MDTVDGRTYSVSPNICNGHIQFHQISAMDSASPNICNGHSNTNSKAAAVVIAPAVEFAIQLG